jgi:23S rRNA (uracil1939-C5)-methyltransferase
VKPRAPVWPEQIIELPIEGTGDAGDGLGKVGNYVVFVPRALAGERVRARVHSATSKHGRAELLEVLTPAPDRVSAPCPHFGACGGCQLQHMTYASQLELKRARVQRTLRHALQRPIEVAPLLAPDDPWHQRSKVVLHVEARPSGYRAGLYGQRSRHLVALDQCPAAHDAAFQLARDALAACERLRVPAWDARYGDGCLRGVLVRATSTGALGVVLISATEFLPHEAEVVQAIAALGAASIWVNHLPSRAGDVTRPTRVDAYEPMHLLGPRTRCVYGNDRLVEEIAGVRYLVSATTFFQTSHFGAQALVQLVAELAQPLLGKTVLDVYCGSGLFSLALARHAQRVVGVEDDAAAVADAAEAARANQISNVSFLAGPAQRLLRDLADEKPDVVILDPPRTGCHAGVLGTVTQTLQPARVIYVACDTDALARDAAALEGFEYSLALVRPLDMFPFTHHVETVALFVRNPQVRAGRKRFSKAVGERLLAKAGMAPAAPSRDGA